MVTATFVAWEFFFVSVFKIMDVFCVFSRFSFFVVSQVSRGLGGFSSLWVSIFPFGVSHWRHHGSRLLAMEASLAKAVKGVSL